MSVSRRYEILLPLQFNDGTPVPDVLIGEVLGEPRRRFGAVTWEPQPIRGAWEHGGEVFRDDLMRVIVGVPDTATNRQHFLELKGDLKARFRQIDIWMTTHLVDVV